jgi:hypothetical protein
MPTVTVSTLINRAKAIADIRDNFVTPTQWTTWASQERLALDLFLARSGWTLPLSDFNITVTGSEGGAYSVNPTGGVMTILCVYEYDSSGRMRMLQHEDAVTFLRRTPNYSGAPSGDARTFRTLWSGDNLTLNMYPQPAAGETYRVVYIPHPKGLVLSSPGAWEETSVSYPMGWEERIVLGMARRALIKEESSTSAVDSEIVMCESRMEEACWNRVLASSPAVRNTDQLNYGWTDRFSLPPYGLWIWP